MDLSKLPKLSNTAANTPTSQTGQSSDAPSTAGNATPAGPFCTHCGQPLPADARYCGGCGTPSGGGRPALDHGVDPTMPGTSADAWISAVLGLLFLLLGWSFAKFLFAKLTGQAHHTGVNWISGPNAGTEVSYFELSGYTAWSDSAVFVFGLALVLEAVVLLLAGNPARRGRLVVWVAIVITAFATAYNLAIAGLLLSTGLLPLLSLIAAAIGGYMVTWEWRVLKLMEANAPTAARR